ncbi:hypothetical protein A5784_05830 [Mycobacterium sp. 852013-50091_SCH5140682]|uniref:DUF6390 family protein n=1 Tax=Mycobacterium sp. 852013-50091_SCH5140682 TaxID=1834109 RepID=UPI0007EBBFFD|nr:DUF6390 family protein [Mycobacterium sp. 852013-50091_SCH5140682]OBC08912.1 hypothetical protein A5784_05830 [Mycobacterium sp. 852013-50091_SCH5140682]
MTAADLTNTRGAEMFARYAHAPNQLGYCGPQQFELSERGRDEIEDAARQFTGAWPYLEVMSTMTGIPDRLDYRLVESYWLGGGIGAELDAHAFADALLKFIAPQAGHYWAHLNAELAGEAAPNHCFHVFGVYPWSRLLGAGAVEYPLFVLDSCRISWGTVLSTDRVTAIVSTQPLSWQPQKLSLSPPQTRRVDMSTDATRGLTVAPGDLVAVHWGRICDRLTPRQVARLKDSMDRQLQATNRRLGAQAS